MFLFFALILHIFMQINYNMFPLSNVITIALIKKHKGSAVI